MGTFLGIPTAPRGVGHLRGDEPFPVAARRAAAGNGSLPRRWPTPRGAVGRPRKVGSPVMACPG